MAIVILGSYSNYFTRNIYAAIGDGLTGYWSFDGKNVNWRSNTATDTAGFSRHLSLTSMSTSSAPITGKNGQALFFDGSNDVATNATAISSFISAADATISVWIKPTSQAATNVSVFNTAGVISDSGGFIGIHKGVVSSVDSVDRIWAYNWDGNEDRVGFTFNPNEWVHAVLVHTGGQLQIYKNGSLVSSTASGNTQTITGTLVLGRNFGSVFYQGGIDEPRIYNRALSSSEIQQLYNYGKNVIDKTIKSAAGSSLSSGLIAHWTFDGRDTNWATNSTIDKSGNGYSGTLTNMSTSTTPIVGKIGQALKFDGSNDGVVTSTITMNDNFTVSAWVKHSGVSVAGFQRAVENGYNTSFYLGTDNPTMQWKWIVNNGGAGFGTAEGGTIKKNTWQHIAGTYDGTTGILYVDGGPAANGSFTNPGTDNLPIYIGRSVTGTAIEFFDGSIDDVKIYNRALSPSEISQIYRQGQTKTSNSQNPPGNEPLSNGLIGHWTLDGNRINWRTNTATDSSPTLNHATLVNISTTTDIRTGKIGQALYFNGSSSYVEIPRAAATVSGAITHAIWFKPGEFTDTRAIIGNINGQTGSDGQQISFKNAGATENVGCPGLTAQITFRSLQMNWHHLVCSYDGTNVSIYLDGSFVTSGASTYTTAAENNLKLGSYNGPSTQFYKGLLDDFRIYNRALSSDEVKQLYQLGVSKRR